jgi:hypothetical protein
MASTVIGVGVATFLESYQERSQEVRLIVHSTV